MLLTSSLTKEQQEIVNHINGPAVVESSPGSGKTHSATVRVVNLVRNHGVNPSRILCITFTRKAANEMKTRIREALGTNAELSIFTFHSFACYWLRKLCKEIGWTRFTIMTPDRAHKMMETIYKSTPHAPINFAKYPSGRSHDEIIEEVVEGECSSATIMKLKNSIADAVLKDSRKVSVVDYSAILVRNSINPSSANLTYAKAIYETFIDNKKSKHLMDFDDLLKYGLELFISSRTIRDSYDYVIVDEAQDLGPIDLEILRAITPIGNSIMAIGDQAQSIFGFRGSMGSAMDDFKQLFKPKCYSLSKNFRCDRSIVEVANALSVHAIPMMSTSPKNGEVHYKEFPTSYEELDWITSTIRGSNHYGF